MTSDSNVPDPLILDQAYRAAFFVTDVYVGMESRPDECLGLFHQYLQSGQARRSPERPPARAQATLRRSPSSFQPTRANQAGSSSP